MFRRQRLSHCSLLLACRLRLSTAGVARPEVCEGRPDAGPGVLSLLQERVSNRGSRVPRGALGVEAGWNDLNIVLDAGKWLKIPEPFLKEGGARPHPPRMNLSDVSVRSNVSIVVLVAALRETRTVHTLEDLFAKAHNPSRVFVGVVQQNSRDDEDVVEGLCKRLGTPLERRPPFAHAHRRTPGEDDWGQKRFTPESLAACGPAARVRVYRMDAGEAAGPVYARAQQRRLLSPGKGLEDFCLQIDAHAVFAPGWDTQLLGEFAQTENEYAVLSTYPTDAATALPDGTFPNSNGHWEMPHICTAQILQPGVVRNDQASAVANLQRPALGKFWAAGLSFSRCHAERDVPSDPSLRQIFDGEEFSRGARLWTNGYDFYSLARPVLGVYYGEKKGGKGDWSHVVVEETASDGRLQRLLCQEGSVPPEALRGFDLGTRRRFEDYVALTGVDCRSRSAKGTPCGVAKWTAWRPGSDPPYEALRGAPPPI
uniref:Uncharacterized protein n=1 Tax=Alexandrium monilatum TaxID=311494 RepID=A0A7S4S1C0_9DINO